jgi:hypothetical protein
MYSVEGHSSAYIRELSGLGSWGRLNFALTAYSEVQHSPVPLPGALGTEREVFSPKRKDEFAERTSMIAHIYPSVLQAGTGPGLSGATGGAISGVAEGGYAGSWI